MCIFTTHLSSSFLYYVLIAMYFEVPENILRVLIILFEIRRLVRTGQGENGNQPGDRTTSQTLQTS